MSELRKAKPGVAEGNDCKALKRGITPPIETATVDSIPTDRESLCTTKDKSTTVLAAVRSVQTSTKSYSL